MGVAAGEPTVGVTLQPGVNSLRFRAAPLKRGLYCVKGAQARLGRLRLSLPVVLPDEDPSPTAGGAPRGRPPKDGAPQPTVREFLCGVFRGLGFKVDSSPTMRQRPLIFAVLKVKTRATGPGEGAAIELLTSLIANISNIVRRIGAHGAAKAATEGASGGVDSISFDALNSKSRAV